MILLLACFCSFYLGFCLSTYLISYKIIMRKRLELGPASLREYSEIKKDCLISSLLWPFAIFKLYNYHG